VSWFVLTEKRQIHPIYIWQMASVEKTGFRDSDFLPANPYGIHFMVHDKLS